MGDDVMEPLEQVVIDLKRKGYVLSAHDLLGQILFLFQASFVTIMQEPIPAFGQTFPSRLILAESSRDVLGDLSQGFEEFWVWGDYVRKEPTCARAEHAGVPFGIYLVVTEAGRRECNDSKYSSYYEQR